MLGVPPVEGRTFLEEEGVPGAAFVTVLGYDIWQNRFGGDPSIVGQTVRLNGETAEIVGVMPRGFEFPVNQDLWVPIRRGREAGERRTGVFLVVTGYLREGVSLESASAEAAAIASRLEAQYPENEGLSARVMPFKDRIMPEEIRNMMLLMMAVVTGVLLVASANVANVLLARAATREREVAVRSAMGADRWRVIRQLLAETLVLAVAGALVGLLLSEVGLEFFHRSVQEVERPYWISWVLDAPALFFTSAVTLLTAVAAGTIPALRASAGSIATVLRDESRGSSSLRLGRSAGLLVVGELTVSCGLMIAAGLMVRTLMDLDRLDLGFETENIMTARVGLFQSEYPDPASRSGFYHEVLDRARSRPGTEAAAFASVLPGTGGGEWLIQVDGEAYMTESDIPRAARIIVSDGFFETFDIQVLEGRVLMRSESEWDGEPVAVVNSRFAEAHLAAPLGRRIRVGGVETENPWMRVVGVVENAFPGTGAFGGGGQVPEAVYVGMGSNDSRFMSLAVRGNADASGTVALLRSTVAEVDPDLPLYWVRAMDETVAQGTFMYRIFGFLFSLFGGAALFLAAVGLYGVIDFSVSNRLREMGIRIALGAGRRDIMWLVLRRVLTQLSVGAGLGILLGFALAAPLSSTLFGVDRFNAGVYITIVLTLFLVGLAAALVPVRRALAIDPVVAMTAS
jgi:predicted permease